VLARGSDLRKKVWFHKISKKSFKMLSNICETLPKQQITALYTKVRTKKVRTKKVRTKKVRTKKIRTKKVRTKKVRTKKVRTKGVWELRPQLGLPLQIFSQLLIRTHTNLNRVQGR
jgi:hypothetical protein